MNFAGNVKYTRRGEIFRVIGMFLLTFMAVCILMAILYFTTDLERHLCDLIYPKHHFAYVAFGRKFVGFVNFLTIAVPLNFIVAFIYFKFYAMICEQTGEGIIYKDNSKYFNPKKRLSCFGIFICFILVVATFVVFFKPFVYVCIHNYVDYLGSVKGYYSKANDIYQFYEDITKPFAFLDDSPNIILVVLILDFLCLPLFIKYFLSLSIPKDHEIDKQCMALFNQFQNQTISKYGSGKEGIDSAPPIFLKSWLFGKKESRDLVHLNASDVVGKDSCWRSPEVALTAWLFREDKIIYFKRVVSLVSENVKDNAEKIDYKDIVTVKTADVYTPLFQNDHAVGKTPVTQLILRHSGEEEIQCACCSPESAGEVLRVMQDVIEKKKSSQIGLKAESESIQNCSSCIETSQEAETKSS